MCSHINPKVSPIYTDNTVVKHLIKVNIRIGLIHSSYAVLIFKNIFCFNFSEPPISN